MSVAGLQSTGTRIQICSSCESPLPLSNALVQEDSRIWICNKCSTEYNAALASDYSIDELRNVSPEPVFFDLSTATLAAPEMLEFAKRFGARESKNVEKRSATRHPVVAAVYAMEFDDLLRPCSPPFQVLSRNLSAGGICLIHSRSISSKFLVIEMTAAGGVPIQTLAHVLRRRPIGPYHDIGAEFVTKLATSNSKTLR